MGFEADFYSMLQSLVDGRVYPVWFQEDTDLPAISFRNVGGKPDNTQTSSNRNLRMRVTVWSRTYDEALVTATTVTDAIGRGGSSFGAMLDGELGPEIDPTTGIYQTTLEYDVWLR